MTTTPKPLPPGSNRLRTSRVEAWVGEPHPTRPGWRQVDMGRFTSVKDARRWADEVHPGASRVNLTFYAANTGWRSQAGPTRKDGVWSDQ